MRGFGRLVISHCGSGFRTVGARASCLGRAVRLALCVTALVAPVRAQSPHVLVDPVGDAVVRRTDLGADGPIDPNAHRLPDIAEIRLGAWSPADAQSDLFGGQWVAAPADFVRIDLVFDGLVNPPGTLGCCGDVFDPFRYGPHPVFGYVEIDLDGDEDTGGELDWPQLTYPGNVARWGGVPGESRFSDRVARSLADFDNDTTTPPYVERTGSDFGFELLGWNITAVDPSIAGDGDLVFEEGETWALDGWFFPRAHGYEDFSFACCSGLQGQYIAEVTMRFAHDPGSDRTTVSLVYPLTNAGSAAMRGESVEDDDGDASNQNSVEEALGELVFSATNAPAQWRQDPDFAIIEQWEFKSAGDYLDPAQWRVAVAVACSYSQQAGFDVVLAWTDIYGNVVPGDYDGDGVIGAADLAAFDAYLAGADGATGIDGDGVVNGEVQLINFGPNFSLFDRDYDGVVDADDRPCPTGDLDGDGDVDLADLAVMLAAYGLCAGQGGYDPAADLDASGCVDLGDLALLLANYGLGT